MNVSSWAHTVFYLLGNIFLPHKRPLQTTGAQIKNSCKNWNRSFSAFYIFLPLLLVLLSPSLWQWQHWDQMVIEGCHLSQRKTLSSMSLCTPQGRERERVRERKNGPCIVVVLLGGPKRRTQTREVRWGLEGLWQDLMRWKGEVWRLVKAGGLRSDGEWRGADWQVG